MPAGCKALCIHFPDMSAPSPNTRRSSATTWTGRLERLEHRRALAVTASLEGGTLRIALDAAEDFASLAIENGRYVVSTASTAVQSFATGGVNSIVVDGSPAPGQTFVVADGTKASVVDSLTITSSVETTVIRGRIDAAGSVTVDSPQIAIAQDVVSKGPQTWGGEVRLLPAIARSTNRIPIPTSTSDGPAAVSGDGSTLIMASDTYYPGFFSVVDVGGRKPTFNIPWEKPASVAVSHDGRRAYVAHDRVFWVDDVAHAWPVISVIDVQSQTIVASLELPLRAHAGPMALSPDGHRLYLACDPFTASPRLFTFDVGESSLALAGGVDLPFGVISILGDVTVSPDGRRVYVADRGVNWGGFTQTYINPSVAVVDCDELRVVEKIPLDELGPGGLKDFKLAPDGRTAFALGVYNRLSVIDTERLVVSRELFPQSLDPEWFFPQNFHIAANGTSLLVNYNGGRVVDVDPVTGKARRCWPLGDTGHMFGTADGTRSFVRSGDAVVAFESPPTASVTLSGHSVTFRESVDGPAGLVIRSRGATVLQAAAGAETPLASFASDAPGTAAVRSVTTTGPQRYADATVSLGGDYQVTGGHRTAFEALGRVQLAGDVSLMVRDGHVVFADSIDAASPAGGSLSIRSNGTATNVSLRGRIGGRAPLSGIEIHGVAGATASQAVTLDGTPANSRLDGLVIGPGVHGVRFTARGSIIRNFRGRGIDVLGDSRNSVLAGFTISNNAVHGIRLRAGDHSGMIVSGNTIQANGNRSTAAGDGVLIQGFGATLSNNTIRGNGRAGISLQGASARAAVLSNSIADNGPVGSQASGIRIAGSAPPPPPLIESIRRQGTFWKVTFKIAGEPTQRFRLQLFASAAATTDSAPQGDRLVGEMTHVAGGASVTLSVRINRLKPGDWLTATATALSGSMPFATSGFSSRAS
jgi:parallel beta-helix repeat protein